MNTHKEFEQEQAEVAEAERSGSSPLSPLPPVQTPRIESTGETPVLQVVAGVVNCSALMARAASADHDELAATIASLLIVRGEILMQLDTSRKGGRMALAIFLEQELERINSALSAWQQERANREAGVEKKPIRKPAPAALMARRAGL
jgi:hypothetical protein